MNFGNNFKEVDPVLDKWLLKNGLSVFKGEFRDIAIIDSQGALYSIRIEPKNFIGQYKIIATYSPNGAGILSETKSWSKKAFRKNIEEVLDEGYLMVASWIKQNGGARRKAG